jgi:RNA polymerase sigma factor (sigma-70 family)
LPQKGTAASLFGLIFNGVILSDMEGGRTNPGLSRSIENILADFRGEGSLKQVFWDLLSYDRIRDPIPLAILPESALAYTRKLEVFAATEALAIVIAEVNFFPDGGRLEQMIWALKRFLADCVVLLTDSNTWLIVYPDETLKPRVRILPLPGSGIERAGVVAALAAMNAIDDGSGEELGSLAMAESLGAAFPGPTPNIGDILTDFERIAKHPSPEYRELWPFIREAGQYPLLTPEKERGEDLTGREVAPDGVTLPYNQWRLVVHNLRLVIWIASRIPRVGVSLIDTVQEGCIGLMTAARRFDPDRGYRFTTMAYYWVRQAVYRAIHNQCNLIRWPVYRSVVLVPPLISGKDAGRSIGERPLRPLKGAIQRRLWRLSQAAANPIDALAIVQARSAIVEALETLTPTQRVVIERRFGLWTGDEETLDSIGRDLGVTRERIRQIEEKALERLMHPGKVPLLAPHWRNLRWRRTASVAEIAPTDGHPFHDLLSELHDSRSFE